MNKATTKNSHLRLVAGTDLQQSGEASRAAAEDSTELAPGPAQDASGAEDYNFKFVRNPLDDVPYRQFIRYLCLDPVKYSAAELHALQQGQVFSKDASSEALRKFVMTTPADRYGTTLAHALKFMTNVALELPDNNKAAKKIDRLEAHAGALVFLRGMGMCVNMPFDDTSFAPAIIGVLDARQLKRAFPALKRVKNETLEQLPLW